ncbi:MAG: glutamine--tRNA ligase/YqeY domain fusion protein [Firmicutes bacterium]|nr:glutamine--tRNA ligase/YqeY domain fusion protein [Bacillota bacterium]
MSDEKKEKDSNFIYDIIEKEISLGVVSPEKICTRFPPEPNGFLHIGHAKAVCVNFFVAEIFGGTCNLRMDDTNPSKEETKYVESIKKDIKWLGFDWKDRFYYASDYFEEMFQIAKNLIKNGLAYVCDLTQEEVKKFRGDLKNPAVSPFRTRSIEESLDLFVRMRHGEFKDGSKTLRAKIDLSSGNFNMRDPVIYRIMKRNHHMTGDKWPIYPTYDYAHPIEDVIEGITHSLCSLEFEDHRPLYDWVVDNMCTSKKPKQIEFSRLNLEYTIMSKRKLKLLVDNKIVRDWDDPRMPTLSGLRNRGFTPESIKNFCSGIGVSKKISTVEYHFLESCLRDDLNLKAQRVMAVLEPIKLTIENFPENKIEEFTTENNPNDKSQGFRKVFFGRHLFIEKSDFLKEETKNFFRVFPGSFVRLKSAYIIECTGFSEDKFGNVTEVRCKYYPETRGGKNLKGKKIKSTIHWLNIDHCFDVQVNIYGQLFICPHPELEGDFLKKINHNSLKILENCKLENVLEYRIGENFQFLRNGYFCLDPEKNHKGLLIFNKSVSIKSNNFVANKNSD